MAEAKFLLMQKNMLTSALINLHLNSGKISTEVYTAMFQKWAERQVPCEIVVTWPEYITAPDLIQFELIHQSTQYFIDLPYSCVVPGKIVPSDCILKWPTLSMIKLLKFVCAFNSRQSSTSHMENLVADLIASSVSVTVFEDINDIYIVFNMAAWCYVKINKYKSAARMMTVAIVTSSQTQIMKKCAFSHHFMVYVIAQCLL